MAIMTGIEYLWCCSYPTCVSESGIHGIPCIHVVYADTRYFSLGWRLLVRTLLQSVHRQYLWWWVSSCRPGERIDMYCSWWRKDSLKHNFPASRMRRSMNANHVAMTLSCATSGLMIARPGVISQRTAHLLDFPCRIGYMLTRNRAIVLLEVFDELQLNDKCSIKIRAWDE